MGGDTMMVGWVVSTLGGLAFAFASAAVAQAAPLGAYGRLPAIETVEVSPDGKLLALVVTDGEDRHVLVETVDQKTVGDLHAGDKKLRDIQWAGPNHLIITGSVTGHITFLITEKTEWLLATDYNVVTGAQRSLLKHVDAGPTLRGEAPLNVIDAPPQVRIIGGRPLAFVQGQMMVPDKSNSSVSHARPTLFKVDLDAGVVTTMLVGEPSMNGFLIDAAGSLEAMSAYDDKLGRRAIVVDRGGWKAVNLDTAPKGLPSLLGLGRQSDTVLAEFSGFGDEIAELAPTGQWGPPAQPPDQRIEDPVSHRWIGESSLVGDVQKTVFFDERQQAVSEALTRAYPGARVRLVSASDDLRRLVLLVDSPAEGPAYALADLDAHTARWIGAVYPALKPEDISPVSPVSFRAADGLPLTGYLTLPRGKPAKGLPLVVMPHGGPAARDEPGFNWWPQALAARGYAVLQVNFRGSDGFGQAFLRAGDGEFGRKMQTDLSDGVRYLAGQGIVDPARVCIVGASYGGYAALAGATLQTGVYRCAASVAGLSDLKSFASWARSRTSEPNAVERGLSEAMGPEAQMNQISPANLATKVSIPVLLVHGRDDTVVPFEQSQIMFNALKRAGKSVQLVPLKAEDHWLSRGETRLEMLQAVTDFLVANNPPG
jgi:cephalosporin-C deacetylase-like acetyl esterase